VENSETTTFLEITDSIQYSEKVLKGQLKELQKLHVLMLAEILEKHLGLETKIFDPDIENADIVIKIRAPLKLLDLIA
jgi:hypothetical protein